ncbi:MAG: dihydrofolate reductase [Cucumibacter sp.]
MTPRLAIIAAVARNNVIGAQGKLPWKLPSDLEFFKRVTMGKPVIMGRKTFESLRGPLSGRTNIVITARKRYKAPGAQVSPSFEEAVEAARKAAIGARMDEIFVIGGAQIYKHAIRTADRLYVTHVDAEPEGDATFPPIDPAIWVGWASADAEPTAKDSNSYEIRIYERR